MFIFALQIPLPWWYQESFQNVYPALLTVRQKADTSRKYQMYSQMEQLAMFMNICKSCLLCSCNDSLHHVTVYRSTLRHQSLSTKARPEKETTKSEILGSNNKTDMRGLKGNKWRYTQQVRLPCSHCLLLTFCVYKPQHTTKTHNHWSQEFTHWYQIWWLTRQLCRMLSNNNALSVSTWRVSDRRLLWEEHKNTG